MRMALSASWIVLALVHSVFGQTNPPCPPVVPCPDLPSRPLQYVLPGTEGTPQSVPTPESPTIPSLAPTPDPTDFTPSPTVQQAAATETGTQPAMSFNPNIYGDAGPLGAFNPPLIATLPSQQQVALAQSQRLTFPAGTTFSQPVTVRSQFLPGAPQPGIVLQPGTPLPVALDVSGSGVLPTNPPLEARLPGGERVTLQAGDQFSFPAGTVFSRPVQVRTQSSPGAPAPGTIIPAGDPLPSQLNVTALDVPTVEPTPSPTFPVNVLRGAFKITENDSPRPLDRFFFNVNYYSNVNGSINPIDVPATNFTRYVFGFEKTFLDGDASIALRVPYLQVNGDPSVDRSTFGDLSVVFKFAWINEQPELGVLDDPIRGGTVLSSGIVVSAPTGGSNAFSSRGPIIHPWVLQPWVGGIYNWEKVYAQGFAAIAVPTDMEDTTFLFNSLQVGWFAYRNYASPDLLKLVVPLAEIHVNTPLNNRGIFREPIGAQDIVNLLGGVTLGLGSRSQVNLAASAPLTGPKPYDIEALFQLNVLY